MSLHDNRSALAVTLPGGQGRALQAQAAASTKRIARLQQRMAKAMLSLGLDAALAKDSSRYREGLAGLRDQEVRKTQQEIEQLVFQLGSITQQRQQSGAASSLTRNQERTAERRRTRIRQLVDSIAGWQQANLPPSDVTARLPASWSAVQVQALFKGDFPWQQRDDGTVPDLLTKQFMDACAEVRVCAGWSGLFVCGTHQSFRPRGSPSPPLLSAVVRRCRTPGGACTGGAAGAAQ